MNQKTLVPAVGLGLLTASLAWSQTTARPAPEKDLLSNERVRVYEVVLKPGAETPMHTHAGEHTVYVVSGGTLRSTDAEGKSTERTYKDAETVFVPKLSHSLKNVGKTTLRAIVTELKEAPDVATLTGSERAMLADLYRRGTQETLELVAATPDELWDKKPGPDRWSVAEIVEHLGAAESMLFGMAVQGLGGPEDPNWAVVEGGMSEDALLGFLQNRSQKFQAPEPLRPKGGLSRADALAKYGAARAVTAEFVRRADGPVKKHVVAMPVGSMTVHQLLVMIGGHNLRHNAQIREALEQLRK